MPAVDYRSKYSKLEMVTGRAWTSRPAGLTGLNGPKDFSFKCFLWIVRGQLSTRTVVQNCFVLNKWSWIVYKAHVTLAIFLINFLDQASWSRKLTNECSRRRKLIKKLINRSIFLNEWSSAMLICLFKWMACIVDIAYTCLNIDKRFQYSYCTTVECSLYTSESIAYVTHHLGALDWSCSRSIFLARRAVETSGECMGTWSRKLKKYPSLIQFQATWSSN